MMPAIANEHSLFAAPTIRVRRHLLCFEANPTESFSGLPHGI